VAAVSPAVWTSYPQARRANPGAFASAAAFAGSDVIAHAAALGRRPVRIASAYGDPFYPGVRMLARALPAGAVAVFGPGCHDGSFFAAQETSVAGLPWLAISPSRPALHPGSILVTPSFLARSVELGS